MSFARAYSYHMPRQASSEDANRVYESAPFQLLSPSHRSRMAQTPISARTKAQQPKGASPLQLDTGMPLLPMEPLSIDPSTPHASSPPGSHPATGHTASYIDSLLATPRPGYTPIALISPEYWKVFMSNFRTLFTLSWPVILSYLLQFSQGIVSLVFIGHISADALAAAALGNMFANISGYAVAFGLATAVDTLASQAYGAGSMKLIGLIVQRAACIMLLTSIPIYAAWYNCASLLILVKQDPLISEEAGQYVWRLAPSLIPYLMFELLKKYLIAQRIMKPMIAILLVTSLCHALLCYIFIYPMDMGFLGAASATATAQWLMLIIGVGVIYQRGYYKETWPAPSMQIFRGWLAILRFGLPGMLMLCLEWWSFELCALAAGWLGAIQLDSFIVLLQVQSFMFMIPLGLSIAISTVTGNRLGAGQPGLAKQGAGVAIFIGLATQSLVAIVLIATSSSVGRIFSDDERVIDTVTEVFPITGVMLLFDAMQVVCGGVLRGLGYQSIGAITNLTGFYVFGLPLAGLLVWQGWEVKGLVLGLMLATSITASVFVTTIVRVDWEKESRAAVARVSASHMAAERFSASQKQLQLDAEEDSVQLDQSPIRSKVTFQDEQKDMKGDAMELAPSAVRDYHSMAIEEETKEGRPIEHI